MSNDWSSCRPIRLTRFESTADAVADGLARRAGALDDALAAYRQTCAHQYRIDTVGTPELIRDFGSGVRDFGRWTGDVGRGFLGVNARELYMGTGGTRDVDSVMTQPDDVITSGLDDWDDPFRGVAEGAAARLADDLGVDPDQDGPPAWIQHLDAGGTAADIVDHLLEGTAMALAGLPDSVTVRVTIEQGRVVVYGDGRVVARYSVAEFEARIRLPGGSAPRIASTAQWFGRVSTALGGLATASEQWHADAHLSTGEQILRTSTRTIGVVGTSALGAKGGFALGGFCGPGAFICSPVGGILGGIGGAIFGDALVGLLPWMDDRSLGPAERNWDNLEDVIAGASGDVDPALAATTDLMASDLAAAATADDPILAPRVEHLLPSREGLEHVLETGNQVPRQRSPRHSSPSTVVIPLPRAQPRVFEEETVEVRGRGGVREVTRQRTETGESPWVESRPYHR